MNNKRRRRKELESKINLFIKQATESGLFEREYSSEEEKNREIRKIISQNFNINPEFIGVEQETRGKTTLTKMTIEEPVFLD